MHCILVGVISEDGYLTKGSDPNPGSWSSPEDKQFFSEIKNNHKLYVMGSKTYLSANIKPEQGVLRIVLTGSPDLYINNQILGQLEFQNLSPKQFVIKYSSKYESCLVLGGGEVYTAFMEANLVDEAYLTVEPVINQSGVKLFLNNKTFDDYAFKLQSKKELNKSGTILHHYTKI